MRSLLLCIAVLVPVSLFAGDWPQFRGPTGMGHSTETSFPLKWSKTKNVRWQVQLQGDGNNGSPIVSGGKVFVVVTRDSGRQRGLVCYDRTNGTKLWEKWVAHKEKSITHRTNLYGGTTPAADGKHVVVWHSSAGMHCYDYKGNKLWASNLGKFEHIWGYGASPIIYNDVVLCNCGPGKRQFLVAIEKKTGRVLWKVEEPGGSSGIAKPGQPKNWTGSWSTPIVVMIDGQSQVIVSYPNAVKAYDLKDGTVIWKCSGLGKLVYTSPILGKDIGVAMGGYRGPAIGFKLGGKGDVTKSGRLWRNTRPPQRIGSGILIDGMIYMVNENQVVQCINPKTGKGVWKARAGAKGKSWSSLTAVGKKLMYLTQTGEAVVFEANPKEYKELAVNSVGERSNSTIAISNGELFLRTHKSLFCISTQK